MHKHETFSFSPICFFLTCTVVTLPNFTHSYLLLSAEIQMVFVEINSHLYETIVKQFMETSGVMHSNKCQDRLMESQGVKSHCLRIQLWETDSKSRVTEFPVMAKVSDIQSSTQKLQQFKPILLNTTLTASEIKEFSQKPLKKKQTHFIYVLLFCRTESMQRDQQQTSLQNINRSILFNFYCRPLFFLHQHHSSK